MQVDAGRARPAAEVAAARTRPAAATRCCEAAGERRSRGGAGPPWTGGGAEKLRASRRGGGGSSPRGETCAQLETSSARWCTHARGLARRLRPAALGAACALVPPVMATAAVCSASDPLYPRRWVAAPGASNNGAPLRVVQFNILADGLSARHPSNGGFTESPPESLAWDFRRDRLVAEVFRHFEEEAGPDVVAMQEVDHYDELAAEMRGAATRARGRRSPTRRACASTPTSRTAARSSGGRTPSPSTSGDGQLQAARLRRRADGQGVEPGRRRADAAAARRRPGRHAVRRRRLALMARKDRRARRARSGGAAPRGGVRRRAARGHRGGRRDARMNGAEPLGLRRLRARALPAAPRALGARRRSATSRPRRTARRQGRQVHHRLRSSRPPSPSAACSRRPTRTSSTPSGCPAGATRATTSRCRRSWRYSLKSPAGASSQLRIHTCDGNRSRLSARHSAKSLLAQI